MAHPKYQGQHRIPQVYLKQFGYQKEDKWYISIWDKSKNYTENVLIENFTKETNVFDLSFFDSINDRRHFETTSNQIEVEYRTVLRTIQHQGRLTPRHQDLLCHFIANLICRARPYREMFQNELNDPYKREYILNEITMLKPAELPMLKTSLANIPGSDHLNYITGYIMNYLVSVFRSFSFMILKDFDNRGWFTSDNPVIIDIEELVDEIDSAVWIIPAGSEIYLPLSPNYCLFLYHPGSKRNANPLRKLLSNDIHLINEEIHKNICDKIGFHTSEYFIFNTEMEQFYLDEQLE